MEINKRIYEIRVMDYLLEEQGYKKEEVASVEGAWGFKMPTFYTTVTFKNEPHIEYTYFAHHDVLQFDYKVIDREKEVMRESLKNLE